MKIEAGASLEQKALYKLVDMDSYRDIPGKILEADEQEGTAKVMDRTGEAREIKTRPNGFRIMRIPLGPHRAS